MSNNIPRFKISSQIQDWMQKYNIPSCNITIRSNSNILFKMGYGIKDKSSYEQTTEGILYGVGSCTKSLTAIAILQLAQNNELNLNDHINNYIPYFENFDEEITVHNLLCHSSGLPSDGFLTERLNQLTGRVDGKVGLSLATKNDLETHITNSKEYYTDDSDFKYYNTGFILLGKIIENISEKSYSEYVHTNILKPIGIQNAYFIDELNEIKSNQNIAQPYITSEDSIKEGELYLDRKLNAAGGLFVTAKDLSKIIQLLLNCGKYNDNRILKQESANNMLKKQSVDSSYVNNHKKLYGYGIRKESFINKTLISHTGYMAVTSAWMGGLKEDNLCIAIACNTGANQTPNIIGKTVLALIYDKKPSKVVYAHKRKDILSKITGLYTSQGNIAKAKVKKHNTGIEIKFKYGSSWNEYVALPENIEDYLYYTILNSGKKLRVEFEEKDDDILMNFDRWVLSKD